MVTYQRGEENDEDTMTRMIEDFKNLIMLIIKETQEEFSNLISTWAEARCSFGSQQVN